MNHPFLLLLRIRARVAGHRGIGPAAGNDRLVPVQAGKKLNERTFVRLHVWEHDLGRYKDGNVGR
jgi:hypothetical protein